MKKKHFLLLALVAAILQLSSCASMHTSASMGLSVHSGPYGPKVTPSFNVGVYGGGGGHHRY